MQRDAEFEFNLLEQRAVEIGEPAGPVLFRGPEQERNLLSVLPRHGVEAIAHRVRRHLRELYDTAPRFLELDLATDQPITGFANKPGLVEVIDTAANCSATLRCRQAESRHQPDPQYTKRRCRHQASSSAIASPRVAAPRDG
jgi:hypothetical protein